MSFAQYMMSQWSWPLLCLNIKCFLFYTMRHFSGKHLFPRTGFTDLHFLSKFSFITIKGIKIMLICRNCITCLCNETLFCVLRPFLPFSYSLPISLPAVWVLIQLWGRACQLGHFGEVGTPNNLLRLGLCRGNHLLGQRAALALVNPLDFSKRFQVGRWRSRRGSDTSLAQPTRILLHHRTVSRHHRRKEFSVLIHSEHPYCMSSGPMST